MSSIFLADRLSALIILFFFLHVEESLVWEILFFSHREHRWQRLYQVIRFSSCSEEVPTQRAAFPIPLSQQDSFRLPTHSTVTCAGVQTELQQKRLNQKFRQISWLSHCTEMLILNQVHYTLSPILQEHKTHWRAIFNRSSSPVWWYKSWSFDALEPAGSLGKLSAST